MIKFKNLAFTAFLLLAVFTLVTYTACNKKDSCEGINCINGGACNNGACTCPAGYTGRYCETIIDPCQGVTCQNNGTCIDGTCKCAPGFAGTYCEISLMAKLAGTWTANDKETPSGNTLPTYLSIITPSTGNTVTLSNFSDGFFDAYIKATVDGSVLTISSQDPDNDDFIVSGSGTINGTFTSINITYTITSPTNLKMNYTGVWTK